MLFAKYGARDPELWAKSQLEEGIPQLQRFLFLRQAWSQVIDGQDWVQSWLKAANQSPGSLHATAANAIQRCLEKGVTPGDLTDIVRGVQAELLFQLCYLLEDPMFTEGELQDLSWGLFEVDGDGDPVGPRMFALHESVFDTDPSRKA
jgi:hypothetical protein